MALLAQPFTATSEWSCSDDLEAVAAHVAAFRRAPSRSARLRALAPRRSTVAALARVFRSLPVVTAEFSATPNGRELASWFRPERRAPLDRVPVALLELPASQAEYLRGRPRQALRTNIRHASGVGVTCTVVHDPAHVRRVIDDLARRRGQSASQMASDRTRDGLRRDFCVAYDSAGEPLGLSESIVDGAWAGIAVMVTASGHADALSARYALHAHTVGRLIEQGVASVVVGGSMLLTSTGTRYFQRRTGFRPVRLRLSPVPASSTAVSLRPVTGGAGTQRFTSIPLPRRSGGARGLMHPAHR